MKDFNIPMELEKELERLSKRDKFYTWVLVTLVAITFMLGLRFYFQNNQGDAITDQAQIQNGIPLANNNSGNQPAGQGGCCGNGAGATATGASGGGCGSTGGGCGSGKTTQVSNPELETQALELYKSAKGNVDGIKAVVTDFGCHIQVDIADKDSNLLQSYQYRGGQLTVAAQ
jgi:hypothetical protein